MTGNSLPAALCAFDDSRSFVSPERRLMLATVANAIADALGNSAVNHPGERDKARREAMAWFRSDSQDFHTVCHLAGLDPQNTRRAVLRYAATGNPMPSTRRSNRRTPRKEKIAA